MKNILQTTLVIAALLCSINKVQAQCVWKPIVTDGFEYTTPCPDVLTGTTYTTVPQTYVAHSGSRSLYLNFVNCNGGTGTCAGDTVYRRTFSICANTSVRVGGWFTTTFSGPLCNMNLLVLDANNNVLASEPALACPYLSWAQFQSGTVTPTTSTFSFVMITNVDGGNGNDLSFDDLFVEKCVQSLNIGGDTSICNNQSITLNAGSGFTSYLWNNGSTTQTITASTTWTGSINIKYSVQVVDSNGCSYADTINVSFLDCSGINAIDGGNQFAVYPNPATDYITLSAIALFDNAYFNLTDVTGRMVKRLKIESLQQNIKLSELSNGVYFYTITDGKNLKDVGKVKIIGHSN